MAVSPHRKFGFFPVVGGVYCGGGMVKLLLLRGISGDGGFSGWYVRLVLLLGSFPRLLMLSALMDCRSDCWSAGIGLLLPLPPLTTGWPMAVQRK
jgi:hypothetical protein